MFGSFFQLWLCLVVAPWVTPMTYGLCSLVFGSNDKKVEYTFSAFNANAKIVMLSPAFILMSIYGLTGWFMYTGMWFLTWVPAILLGLLVTKIVLWFEMATSNCGLSFIYPLMANIIHMVGYVACGICELIYPLQGFFSISTIIVWMILGDILAPLELVRELPNKSSYRRRLMLTFYVESILFYFVMGLV